MVNAKVYQKMGGRKLGLICAVQKQQEGISVLSFLFRKLCFYHYPGFFQHTI